MVKEIGMTDKIKTSKVPFIFTLGSTDLNQFVTSDHKVFEVLFDNLRDK